MRAFPPLTAVKTNLNKINIGQISRAVPLEVIEKKSLLLFYLNQQLLLLLANLLLECLWMDGGNYSSIPQHNSRLKVIRIGRYEANHLITMYS